MKHSRGKKKLTFSHTAIRSTAQSSHLRRTAKEFLTQGLSYFGTTLESLIRLIPYKTSNYRQTYLVYKMGNKEERYLTRYITGTH